MLSLRCATFKGFTHKFCSRNNSNDIHPHGNDRITSKSDYIAYDTCFFLNQNSKSLIYLLGKKFQGCRGGAKGLFSMPKIFGRGAEGVPGGPIVNVHFRVL